MSNKLKIGAITWKIKRAIIQDMGTTCFNESEITIKKGLEKQIEKETLLHEILHIAFVQTGHADKMDEGLIDALAYTLLDTGLMNLDEF